MPVGTVNSTPVCGRSLPPRVPPYGYVLSVHAGPDRGTGRWSQSCSPATSGGGGGGVKVGWGVGVTVGVLVLSSMPAVARTAGVEVCTLVGKGGAGTEASGAVSVSGSAGRNVAEGERAAGDSTVSIPAVDPPVSAGGRQAARPKSSKRPAAPQGRPSLPGIDRKLKPPAFPGDGYGGARQLLRFLDERVHLGRPGGRHLPIFQAGAVDLDV